MATQVSSSTPRQSRRKQKVEEPTITPLVPTVLVAEEVVGNVINTTEGVNQVNTTEEVSSVEVGSLVGEEAPQTEEELREEIKEEEAFVAFVQSNQPPTSRKAKKVFRSGKMKTSAIGTFAHFADSALKSNLPEEFKSTLRQFLAEGALKLAEAAHKAGMSVSLDELNKAKFEACSGYKQALELRADDGFDSLSEKSYNRLFSSFMTSNEAIKEVPPCKLKLACSLSVSEGGVTASGAPRQRPTKGEGENPDPQYFDLLLNPDASAVYYNCFWWALLEQLQQAKATVDATEDTEEKAKGKKSILYKMSLQLLDDDIKKGTGGKYPQFYAGKAGSKFFLRCQDAGIVTAEERRGWLKNWAMRQTCVVEGKETKRFLLAE